MRNATLCLTLLAAMALAPVSARSQTDASQQPAEEAQVHATLRLVSGTARFQVGELIPFEMGLTSDAPNYGAVATARGREGRRIELDQFRLSPAAGTSDPLRPYLTVFPSSDSMGGSIRTEGMVPGVPLRVQFNLNDWMHFDVPGHYRLSIETKRVSRWAAGGLRWLGIVPLVTNEVEFDIVAADPVWQAQQLKAIIEQLDRAAAPTEWEPDPTVSEALEQLRYLDTPESTRELARRLRGDNVYADRACLQGLLTSPARDVALSAVNRLLAQPDFPVSRSGFWTRAAGCS